MNSLNLRIYLLSLTNWHKYDEIDWMIVKLLEYNQFLGEADASIKYAQRGKEIKKETFKSSKFENSKIQKFKISKFQRFKN